MKGVILAAGYGSRIQELTLDGEVLSVIDNDLDSNHKLRYPSSAVIDDDRTMYIADWGNERVKVMDPEGHIVQSLRGQATESKWARAFLDINLEEAAARDNSDLETEQDYFVNDPHEVSSHIEKLFWAPMSVKLDSQRKIYVTESNRHRVQIYDIA